LQCCQCAPQAGTHTAYQTSGSFCPDSEI
jgi:hypothetical protein